VSVDSPGHRFEFRLPDLGEGIHEAELLEWNVRPGDQVRAFDPLCQVESAKAAVELTSPVEGRVLETRVQAGTTAMVGEVLVVLQVIKSAQAGPASRAEDWVGIVGAPPASSSREPQATSETPTSTTERRVLAAPFVRKLAKELGVRLEDVPGGGPQGRIRAADVEVYAASRSPAAPRAPLSAVAPTEERIPLEGLRKRIADHMLEAVRHAPQVTAVDVFDVTDLVEARERLAPLAQAEGVKLTYLPFIVKAAVEALRAVPHTNAVLDEVDGTIVLKRTYNIGIATAVPGGLLVPVVKRADQLSVLEIAREIGRLVDAARARKSTPEDLSGGTFTITSFGGLEGGALFATPILNYPEVAILGVGRIEQQPRVINGEIVPRHCLGVSFTFDHRVLDGEGAGQFLSALRSVLERPLNLLVRLR